MTKKQIAQKFIDFLTAAPTPYHAVDTMRTILVSNTFQELKEGDKWQLKKGNRYFVVRGDSSLLAFNYGKDSSGFQILGAHTDSPALKIKANPEKRLGGYLSLSVETYGGAILSTWFDRDLSIAGRVSYLNAANRLKTTLVDFQRAVAIVPNLAIHLSSKKNENLSINKQTDVCPLVAIDKTKTPADFNSFLAKEIAARNKKEKPKEILDFDLILYDTQPPGFIGFNEEFIAGQRIDNLLSCFAGLQALIETPVDYPGMLVCNDHEEVGSSSNVGAAGTFLKSVLERICKQREVYQRTLANSVLVSVDNSHGVHPNFPAKHDENHKPFLNQGPVIKINANQRYATSSETSAWFKHVCKQVKVPYQTYINRSDMACGSTIGPITATTLGVKTIDIGAPTFAMHSIRETCGADDIWFMAKALKGVLATKCD